MIDVDKIIKNTRTLLVLVLVEYANEWKSMNHLVVVVGLLLSLLSNYFSEYAGNCLCFDIFEFFSRN